MKFFSNLLVREHLYNCSRTVRQIGGNCHFGEQFGKLFANCSRTMFARFDKKGFWRTIWRIVRELFMNSVRRGGKKGNLANSSANYSRTVHEHCSPGRHKKVIRRTIRGTFHELFMNNIREIQQKRVLANSSPSCSRVVHEQCSSGVIMNNVRTHNIVYLSIYLSI